MGNNQTRLGDLMKRILVISLLLLALSCASTQTVHNYSSSIESTFKLKKDDLFEVTFYNHRFAKTLSGVETGDFYKPAITYKAIPIDEKFKHALTFQMSQFFPARREVLPGNGPLIRKRFFRHPLNREPHFQCCRLVRCI